MSSISGVQKSLEYAIESVRFEKQILLSRYLKPYNYSLEMIVVISFCR